MNIGINLLYLYPNAVGGTETYARGLINGLQNVDSKNRYFLFCSQESATTFIETKNFNIVKLPVSASNRVMRSLFEIFVFPFYLLKYRISAVHSLGYSSPLISPCPTVVNIYDLNWYYHPEDFDYFRRIGWELFVKCSAYFCTKIITSSNSSKKHIRRVLGIAGKKIDVVYGGSPEMKKAYAVKYLSKFGIKSKYLFTLTADIPHKNILGLLEAYRIILQSGRKYTLVIGGLRGSMEKVVENYIKKFDVGENIIILSWLADRDLATLYKYATIFIIPSLHEGFGFPVLEAFVSGTPVVSSKAFSLKEVVGDAGLLFNPRKPADMADQISSAMANPRLLKRLKKLGLSRAKEFDWEKSAKATLQVYNSILKHG